MNYIIITKLEYLTTISLKVKGLEKEETERLVKILTEKKANHSVKDVNYMEVDISGIEMLNLLAQDEFGYRVISQAMAMEHSSLGGRSFQIEKVIWTLGKTVKEV